MVYMYVCMYDMCESYRSMLDGAATDCVFLSQVDIHVWYACIYLCMYVCMYGMYESYRSVCTMVLQQIVCSYRKLSCMYSMHVWYVCMCSIVCVYIYVCMYV
jgi:hypothetical protein